MLLLISQPCHLHLASDIALTAVVFGQEPTLVLWPAVVRSLAADSALQQKLDEFGVTTLLQLRDDGAIAAGMPLIGQQQLAQLLVQHTEVQSF